MFRWHKDLDRLNIPAQQVLRLHRSLSDIQVALPGLPAQQATAYLIVFSSGQGVRCAIALHLHSSSLLVFYLNESGEIRKQDAGRVLNEGLNFAQSMGFLIGDLDFHLLDPGRRVALWDSLPLKSGLAPKAPSAGSIPVAGKKVRTSPPSETTPQGEAKKPASASVQGEPLKPAVQRDKPAEEVAIAAPPAPPAPEKAPVPQGREAQTGEPEAKTGEPETGESKGVEPAAVESTTPPGISSIKRTRENAKAAPGPVSPSPAEEEKSASGSDLESRRLRLREKLGRFLASF